MRSSFRHTSAFQHANCMSKSARTRRDAHQIHSYKPILVTVAAMVLSTTSHACLLLPPTYK